jgi:hypothetical protein
VKTVRYAHQPSRITGLLFIFSAVFWAGCSVTEPVVPANSIIETVTSTVQQRGSPSSTPQPTRTATTTPTVSPTRTTTAEPISSPTEATRTLIPTLAPDERNAFILDLFLYNGGCALPCFWGFTPGETTWDEARQVLEKLNDNIYEVNMGKGKYRYEVELQNWEDLINLLAVFYVREGIIENIDSQQIVYKGSPHHVLFQKQFSLNSLLTKNGPPDRINLLFWEREENDTRPQYFNIFFFHDRANFVYRFEGEVIKDGNRFRICPKGVIGASNQETYYFFIIVKEPDINLPFEKIYEDNFRGQSVKIFSLEEATGISIEEFARMGLEGDLKVCLNIDPDKWP